MPPNLFTTIFIQPTLNVLVVFLHLFLLLKIPGAFGLAIISLTVAVRLLLHPFFSEQIRTARKMQEIQPHLQQLSRKHKSDPKKLQEEQMRIFKEAGVNPASGCLFAIIQLPLFIGLYQSLNLFLRNGTGMKIIQQVNALLYNSALKIQSIDPTFFGFNLVLSPSTAKVWYYYLIPVVTGVLQYIQTQLSSHTMPQATPAKEEGDKKKEEKEGDTAQEFQKALNLQMKYFFPFMIGYFSFSLPVGLSLYWNTFSLFSIIQHLHLDRKLTPPKSSDSEGKKK